jgi:hypothetical protein
MKKYKKSLRSNVNRDIIDSNKETAVSGKGGERRMNWTEIMNKAWHLALYSGTFTDDPQKKADDVYLVKDIRLVVDAFAKDIEEGRLGSYSEPAEFLDKHGIEWE